MRISEAYTILSSPTKRAIYDRDHMKIAHTHANVHRAKGSYASTGPAGGRPASGLSRRRGTFHGPPPSFYRSGGWGAQGDKRKAAHDESTGGAGSPSGATSAAGPPGSDTSGSGSRRGTVGGMGPGQDPFGHREEVPHFDKESHERTGRNIDKLRRARQGVDDGYGGRVPIELERGVAGMFFAIGGIILLSIMGPVLISQFSTGGGRKTKEKP